MANTGLRTALFSTFDETQLKYTSATAQILGRIQSENFSAEYNTAEAYADDVLAESDVSFRRGTASIGVLDDDEVVQGILFGSDNTDDEVTSNINDLAPYIGYGHIVPKVYKGVKSYKVEMFPRCKVNNITADKNTQGEQKEFGSCTIELTVYAVDAAFGAFAVGDWRKVKSFATYAEAETYLKTLLTPPTGQGGN